jgi:hypothetical protein
MDEEEKEGEKDEQLLSTEATEDDLEMDKDVEDLPV